MQAQKARLRLNSVFFKFGLMIVFCMALLLVINSQIQARFVKHLTMDFVGNEAQNFGLLSADVIAGSLRFGKSEQIETLFRSNIENGGGQILGLIAVTVDGGILTEVADTPYDRSEILDMSRRAIARQEVVVSGDGLVVATPVRFGKDLDVIGTVVGIWSPAPFLAEFAKDNVTAIAISSVVTLFISVGALLFFGRSLVTPMNRCRLAILSLAESRFDVTIPGTARGDEMGEMARALQVLRDALASGEALQKEAAQKSAAFLSSSAATMIAGEDMKIQYVNPRMIELLGQYAAEIRQELRDIDLADPVGSCARAFYFDRTQINSRLAGLDNAPIETIVRFGEVRLSLVISRVRTPENEPAGFVLEWSDVSEVFLNRATMAAIDTSLVKAEFKMSGELIAGNALFREMRGLAPGQADDCHIEAIMDTPGETGGIKAVLARIGKGEAFTGKIVVKNLQGANHSIDGSLNCVLDQTGSPIRILVLGNDVTQSEADLAAALERQETMQARQNEVVEALRIGLKDLASGNLTISIDTRFDSNYEGLREDFNTAVDNLSRVMQDIAKAAENIHNEANDISSTTEGLSQRTESTAATLEETSAALDELTTSVGDAAKGAAQADAAVIAAKENAENSGRVVLETVSAMDQIAESSEKITSIIKVIDDIAFQTNLLALNAGVEAARAGEAGRGFAVVASEVRALAQRSSDAAREINDLIAQSGSQVKAGVDLVGRTGGALQDIVTSVSKISNLVSEIALSARNQSAGLLEINKAVALLDQSTQQNAARLEETTAASESLRNDAVGLVDAICHFKIAKGTRERGGVVKPPRASRDMNTVLPPPSLQRAKKPTQARKAPQSAIAKAETEWEDF